jgi:hypothetical protein
MRELIKVEHVWSKPNDRWICIERYRNTEYIGLNYMQGDDYERFKDDWCRVDKGLSDFYEGCKGIFSIQKKSITELNFINDVMWTYHNAVACYEEYEHIPVEVEVKCKCKKK